MNQKKRLESARRAGQTNTKPRRRSNSPAGKDSAKTTIPALLSLDEVNAMRKLLRKEDPPEANNSIEYKLARSAASDKASDETILFADKLLRACDEAIQHSMDGRWHYRPPFEVCYKVLDLCLEMVLPNNAEFAEHLAVMLRARGEGKEVALKDLGVKQKPGRKGKPYDLKFVVPAAIKRLLAYRVEEIPPDGTDLRRRRITREELRETIRIIGKSLGAPHPVRISNPHLSTYITKYGIGTFMHDPHRPTVGKLPPPLPIVITDEVPPVSLYLKKMKGLLK